MCGNLRTFAVYFDAPSGTEIALNHLYAVMKIALLGYGKMGKAIEQLALQRGHSIVAKIDNEADWQAQREALRAADVAVEFSMPSTVLDNIRKCFELGVPIVVGTTGWYGHLMEALQQCRQHEGSLFYASNFSIGMNMMFALNKRLAQLMDACPDYAVSITETHHIHKLDAPSGTAISLANDIAASMARKSGWKLVAEGEACGDEEIPIRSIREGEIAGIHEVVYDSPVDTLTLVHSAKSRQGLALGAVLAAEYLCGKKGVYTMNDLLNITK